MSIQSELASNHLILCRTLLLQPSLFPSIRVSFSINPSNKYSGLIFFRIDWLDLPAVQGTLKSLLQYQSLKASVLRHSAFFMVQLSHAYMTTGKTIVMTRWTFVSKVMSLIFNMLSRLVTVFLPRSKRLLISWLQSPSALILEPKKINTEWASVSVCPNDFIYIQRTKKMNLLKRPGGMIRKLHN